MLDPVGALLRARVQHLVGQVEHGHLALLIGPRLVELLRPHLHDPAMPRPRPASGPVRPYRSTPGTEAGGGAGDVGKSCGGARRAPSPRTGPWLPPLPPLQPLLQEEEPRLAERSPRWRAGRGRRAGQPGCCCCCWRRGRWGRWARPWPRRRGRGRPRGSGRWCSRTPRAGPGAPTRSSWPRWRPWGGRRRSAPPTPRARPCASGGSGGTTPSSSSPPPPQVSPLPSPPPAPPSPLPRRLGFAFARPLHLPRPPRRRAHMRSAGRWARGGRVGASRSGALRTEPTDRPLGTPPLCRGP